VIFGIKNLRRRVHIIIALECLIAPLKLKIDKNRKDFILGGDINYVWETWKTMVTDAANESIDKSKPVKKLSEFLSIFEIKIFNLTLKNVIFGISSVLSN
jgi:hypothetical protein